MTDTFDRLEIYRQLRIYDVVVDGEAVLDPGKALSTLKRYFDGLDYHFLYQNNWGSWGPDQSVLTEFDWTKLAARELFALCASEEEALGFVKHVTRAGPYNKRSPDASGERAHRIEFWSKAVIEHLPEQASARFHSALYLDLFCSDNFYRVLKLVDVGLQHFRSEPEAFELVRHFIQNFDRISGGYDPRQSRWGGRGIASYLSEQYENGTPDVWSLILTFWCDMSALGAERDFLKMWDLCQQEPDRCKIGEAALVALARAGRPLDMTRKIADRFLETCPDQVRAGALEALMEHKDELVSRRGFFWLAELYKDRSSTFETLMTTVAKDPDAKRREYAFRLVFFHYFSSPDHAARIVEAAWSDPDNLEEFKAILAGEAIEGITPHLAGGITLDIATRGNDIRRARMFQKACRKAGIDSGIKIEESPLRDLKEALGNVLASDLSKKAMHRFVYKMMSPGERKFLNDAHIYQEFVQHHRTLLEQISREDAAAIHDWLEAAWEDALLRFGYGHMAGLLINIAQEHLLAEDKSEPAERIRAHFDLERTLSNRVFDAVHGNPAMEERQHQTNSFYAEIRERAFFLMLEGQEETMEAAIKRGIEDAVLAYDQRKFRPKLP